MSETTAPVGVPETYVSLFDKLKVLAEHLPISHVINESPVGRFVAALAHYAEFGDEILNAALKAAADVEHQLTLPMHERGPDLHIPKVLTAPEPASVATTEDQGLAIAQLQAQLAALQGAQAETTVTSEAV